MRKRNIPKKAWMKSKNRSSQVSLDKDAKSVLPQKGSKTTTAKNRLIAVIEKIPSLPERCRADNTPVPARVNAKNRHTEPVNCLIPFLHSENSD